MSRQIKNTQEKNCGPEYHEGNEEDFIRVLRHISRPIGFRTMSSADRLYYLLFGVAKPTAFNVLRNAAQLIGISHRELCMILTDYADLFFELDPNKHLWVTRCYAEECGLVRDDPSPIIQQNTHTVQSHADNTKQTNKSNRPTKKGIVCLSPFELETAAEAFCQTQDYRVMRADDETLVLSFMSRLSRPVRLADLEYVVYNILGLTVAKSTFRKFMNLHRERYIAPTHGVWCTVEAAHHFGYHDWRDTKNQSIHPNF